MWASHVRYVNDAKDSTYLLELLQRVARVPTLAKRAADVEAALDVFRHAHSFVVSFSEMHDLLSQWRSYCPVGQGIALGFRTNALKAIGRRNRMEFAPCIYDQRSHRRYANTIVRRTVQVMEDIHNENPTHSFVAPFDNPVVQTQLLLSFQLSRVAPFVKHPAFAEEREWRLSTIAELQVPKDVRFRRSPHSSTLIPYRIIPMDRKELISAVSHVIIGPTPHPDLAHESVSSFLTNAGLRNVRVKNSRIPFKAW